MEGADFFTVFWKINLPLAKGGFDGGGLTGNSALCGNGGAGADGHGKLGDKGIED